MFPWFRAFSIALTWTRLYCTEPAQSAYYFSFVVQLPTKVASNVKASFLTTRERSPSWMVASRFVIPFLATYQSAGSTVPFQRY